MEIYERAYAKLNLSLDIVAKMPDGYHDMKMVFQTIDLHDDISIRITDTPEIKLSTNVRYIPNDSTNIAVKAAAAFFAESGITGYGAEISLLKRIPVCAGMGGGSADGAAVLRGINKLFDNPLSTETLLKLGRDLGSDVPFCIIGGTVLGCGRGEVMTDLAPLPDCHIVVCKPSFSVSTPALFKRINVRKIRLRPDTDGIINALEKSDIYGVARRMYNIFEDVLPSGADTINNIKSTMLDYNAAGSAMTGTGSAVFGVFTDYTSAKEAHKRLSADYSECYISKPVGKIL